MPYRFNVPQAFQVRQQPQVGSMFQQPMAQPLTGNFQPQFQPQFQQRQPVAWNQHPIQQQNYVQPQPAPHALTGNFQQGVASPAVQQLTQPNGQQAQFNPALTNPTPYMGKTMQPQGVYAQSTPDYIPQPMPATGINALGFGSQAVPMPTVTR